MMESLVANMGFILRELIDTGGASLASPSRLTVALGNLGLNLSPKVLHRFDREGRFGNVLH